MKKYLSMLICIIFVIINTGCHNITNIKKISTYETELNAANYFNNLKNNVINKCFPDIKYKTEFNYDKSANEKYHYLWVYFDSNYINNDDIAISLYNTNEDNNYGYEKYYIAYQNNDNNYWSALDNIYIPTDLEKSLISNFLSDVTGKEIENEDIEKVFQEARNKVEDKKIFSNLRSNEEFCFTGYINNIKNAPYEIYIRNNGTVYNRFTIRYEFGATTNDSDNNFTVNSIG